MPANGVTLENGCKINLYLRVGARRPDAYHDIESLFLPLDTPRDTMRVRPLDGPMGRISVSFYAAAPDSALPGDLPGTASGGSANDPPNGSPNGSRSAARKAEPLDGIDPGSNTLTRAYALFAEASGFAPALDIRVFKGIPQGAGLGGGSANAAALLLHLQRLAQKAGTPPLAEQALTTLAARAGADVPFFLTGRSALVSGIGERLTPCAPPFPGAYLVLVCPRLCVATAWAFNSLDEQRAAQAAGTRAPQGGPGVPAEDPRAAENPAQKNGAKRLTSVPPQASYSLAQAQDFQNDFEDLVFAHFPELARLHGILCESGAKLARMSGTGASLFAVYDEKRIAEKAAKMLANEDASVYTQRLPAG